MLNLLEGMTLGLDTLDRVPTFKNYLINTGTIHVVVVSGYNISLVANLLKKIIGTRFSGIHILSYILLTLLYTKYVGAGAPVVRAWLMYVIATLLAKNGRSSMGILSLIFSCIVMLTYDIKLLNSLSFLLSAGATLGLLLYGDLFSDLLRKLVPYRNIFVEDLSASLSASLIVLPLISYKFGRVGLLSPFINMFILWTVPAATTLGFLGVLLSYIDMLFSTSFIIIAAIVVYPFLSIFTFYIKLLGNLSWLSLNIQISLPILLSYYFVLFVISISLFFRKKYV